MILYWHNASRAVEFLYKKHLIIGLSLPVACVYTLFALRTLNFFRLSRSTHSHALRVERKIPYAIYTKPKKTTITAHRL